MKSSTLIYFVLLLFLSSCFQAQNGADDLTEKINAARELRAQIQSDLHRPTYHFVSPEGLASPFDPNGAIYHDGQYHLGYIYQKLSPEGEEQHVWGHAVSTDLFHWSLYPPMLEVNEGGLEEGIFSGGAFRGEDGTPHINSPEEVKDLRLVSHSCNNVEVLASQETTLPNMSGKALEIKARIADPQSEEFGLKVLASSDGREETIIKYDQSSEELVIDFANESINEEIKASKHIFGDDSQFHRLKL